MAKILIETEFDIPPEAAALIRHVAANKHGVQPAVRADKVVCGRLTQKQVEFLLVELGIPIVRRTLFDRRGQKNLSVPSDTSYPQSVRLKSTLDSAHADGVTSRRISRSREYRDKLEELTYFTNLSRVGGDRAVPLHYALTRITEQLPSLVPGLSLT